MKRASLTCLVTVLAWATSVHATVGGPQLAEVLGCDPLSEKVYVAIRFFDDMHEGPAVYYFDLRRRMSYQPVRLRVAGSRALTIVDSLKARLRPLRHMPTPSGSIVRVLESDSIDIGYPLSRYRVRFSARLPLPRPYWAHQYDVDVIAYGDSTVRQLAVFAIPDRDEWLAILSFVGVSVEGGYETQFPVLLGATDAPEVLGPIKGDP